MFRPPTRKASVGLLYVTDRAPGTEAAKTLPYSADRSHSMAFGSVTVEFGKGSPGTRWLLKAP
jgi:hypothetical protein